MEFSSVVQLNGATATGIPVPADVVDALDGGGRPKVVVTIGDYTYRTSIAPWQGAHMLSLSAENRKGAGLAAGDPVTVSIALDSAPRTVDVPDDFAAVLKSNKAARTFFDSLSYSNQRWFVDGINSAKKAETRQTRITKYVDMLAEGRSR